MCTCNVIFKSYITLLILQDVPKLSCVTVVNTIVVCEYLWEHKGKQDHVYSVFLRNGSIENSLTPPCLRRKVARSSLLFSRLPLSQTSLHDGGVFVFDGGVLTSLLHIQVAETFLRHKALSGKQWQSPAWWCQHKVWDPKWPICPGVLLPTYFYCFFCFIGGLLKCRAWCGDLSFLHRRQSHQWPPWLSVIWMGTWVAHSSNRPHENGCMVKDVYYINCSSKVLEMA